MANNNVQNILSQLDAIENQLDTLVDKQDIQVMRRMETLVKKFKPQVEKLSRAGFDVSATRDNLDKLEKRIDTFLREYQ